MPHSKIAKPLVLAFVLAAGVATAWVFLVALIGGSVASATRQSSANYSVVVQTDGTPLIQRYQYAYQPSAGPRYEYYALDGTLIRRGQRTMGTLSGAAVSVREYREPLFGLGPLDWPSRVSQFQGGYSVSEETGQVLSQNSTIWYFIHDGLVDGHGYFVGYELEGNRRLGYLGLDGFSQTEPPLESQFAISQREYMYRTAVLFNAYNYVTSSYGYYDPTQEPLFVRSGDKIVKVEIGAQTVQTVFEDPSILRMARMERPREASDENRRRTEPALAVRLPDRITVLSLEGERLANFPLPESIREKMGTGAATFYELPDGDGLVVQQRTDRASGEMSATLWRIDTIGNLAEEREVVLGRTTPANSPRFGATVGALAFPAPGIMVPGLVFFGGPVMLLELHPDMGYWQAVGPAFVQTWPVLLGLILLGIALSGLCVRRQRKYALPWTKTWAVFIFLFGVPGYLAYVCHRRWPVREECPECHVPAPQDRDNCASCNTPFPAPEPKGIEVFA